MIIELNPIELAFRGLIAGGKKVQKLFSGNPNEQGFVFPGDILNLVYSDYFQSQTYVPHPKGLLNAREAISSYYARHDVRINPENIIFTSGTSESFLYLFSLLTRPGDNVLCPNPSYPLFDHIAALREIELRHYRLLEDDGWTVCMDDLNAKADERTKALILISPHNPTGSVISESQLSEMVDWANSREMPIICDEVFSEFVFGGEKYPRADAVAKPKLCFTLNGISKMFALPAMKLGWMAVTGLKPQVDSAIDKLETIADTFLSVHVPIQLALPLLFNDGKDFLAAYHKEVERRMNLAVALLKKSGDFIIVPPAGGFYLMVEVTKQTGLTEEEFVIRLMEAEGIFVHPGYFYDYEKGIHLVISILTRPDLLEKGIRSLIRFLEKH